MLYQSEAQWEQLGGILMKENGLGGHVICESPRLVLIRADDQHTVDVILGRLSRLRSEGAIAEDISNRSWTVDVTGAAQLKIGKADGGCELYIANADPSFGVAACEAMLRASSVNHHQCTITINEASI